MPRERLPLFYPLLLLWLKPDLSASNYLEARSSRSPFLHHYEWMPGYSAVEFQGCSQENLDVACQDESTWNDTASMVACEETLPDHCFMKVKLVANITAFDLCQLGWAFRDGEFDGYTLANLSLQIIVEPSAKEGSILPEVDYDCRQAFISFPFPGSVDLVTCKGPSDAYYGVHFDWPFSDLLYFDEFDKLESFPPTIAKFELRDEMNQECYLPLWSSIPNVWTTTVLPWERTTTSTAPPTTSVAPSTLEDWRKRDPAGASGAFAITVMAGLVGLLAPG